MGRKKYSKKRPGPPIDKITVDQFTTPERCLEKHKGLRTFSPENSR
jgi:hypothetical protein